MADVLLPRILCFPPFFSFLFRRCAPPVLVLKRQVVSSTVCNVFRSECTSSVPQEKTMYFTIFSTNPFFYWNSPRGVEPCGWTRSQQGEKNDRHMSFFSTFTGHVLFTDHFDRFSWLVGRLKFCLSSLFTNFAALFPGCFAVLA